MGPFRGVKYDPIFESNLAPLKEGQYSPSTWADLDPKAEMGPAWAGIAFWLSCLGLNCAQMAPEETAVKVSHTGPLAKEISRPRRNTLER